MSIVNKMLSLDKIIINSKQNSQICIYFSNPVKLKKYRKTLIAKLRYVFKLTQVLIMLKMYAQILKLRSTIKGVFID